MEFNELINIFSSLASDILNRSPMASQLLHGFICKTQQMISDLPSVKLNDRLSGLMTSTSSSILQSLTGIMNKEPGGTTIGLGGESTADDISLLHPPQQPAAKCMVSLSTKYLLRQFLAPEALKTTKMTGVSRRFRKHRGAEMMFEFTKVESYCVGTRYQ